MRFSIPTPVLLDAVGQAASVAAAKSPKRILECVALRAKKGEGVTVEANDLDVSLRITLTTAQIDDDGVVVVPATRLVSVLREVAATASQLTLVGVEQRLDIDTADCHFRIHGEDPAEFPPISAFPSAGVQSVPLSELRGMIDRTLFATAREAGRFALHGVQIRFGSNDVEFVATDGRRLARVVRPAPNGPAADVRVIVGTKPLSLVGRLSPDGAAKVDLALEERRIFFRCGPTLLSSRLIDGSFPPYEQVIPAAGGKGFSIAAGELGTALRRASLLATKEMQSVAMEFGTDRLTLTSRSPDVGEAKVELKIAYTDAPERLGFNPLFIVDALKVLEPTREVRFEFTNPKAPGKLSDGQGYVYVVMPVSTAE
jgi:DNA polymerase-3 subunit beta